MRFLMLRSTHQGKGKVALSCRISGGTSGVADPLP